MQTIQTPDGPAPDGTPWHVLREDYLAGHSARSLCVNYDVPMSTFRARAKREGWRRCDQPEPDPFSQPEPDDEPFDPDLLVIRARAHLRRAVTAGDALGALRWMKLVEQLTDFARRERGVRVRNAPDPRQAERDAIEAAYRRREAAETGTTRDIRQAGDWSVDSDALSDPHDAPESNAGRSAVTGYVSDRLSNPRLSAKTWTPWTHFSRPKNSPPTPSLRAPSKASAPCRPAFETRPEKAPPGRDALMLSAPRFPCRVARPDWLTLRHPRACVPFAFRSRRQFSRLSWLSPDQPPRPARSITPDRAVRR